MAGEYQPDWILMLDADELVEEASLAEVRKLADQSSGDVYGWSFPFYYLWDNEHTCRNTGKYHNTKVIRLYRYDKARRPPSRPGHSTGVPDDLDRRLIFVANVRMLHYGYMLKEDRETKYKFYTGRDADPLAAGSGGKDYEHLIEDDPPLVVIPKLDEWRKGFEQSGDFLLRGPKRVVVSNTFPTAHTITLEQMKAGIENSVDEVRLFYVVDGQDIPTAKDTMTAALRVLRPGGRIDVIATDFVGLCGWFAKASPAERVDIERKFFTTPLRVPVKTLWFEDRLAFAMDDVGIRDAQRVPIPVLPFRLHMIGYKVGDGKWL
jgi:hypothetical protein